MNDDNVTSIAQLREFLKLSNGAKFNSESVEESYTWISRVLLRFRYKRLRKGDRSLVKQYLITMTGYSETQIDRLIHRWKKQKVLVKQKRTQPTFERFYTPDDVALLAEVDNAENRRNGAATKQTCIDMYQLYGDVRFERLSKISVSHLYTLRGTRVYTSRTLTYTKTNPTSVNIGVRTKPKPDGIPGYIRVDSVHQGDAGKEKGVYHINLVDEVVQWEVVVCVEVISEAHLLPALEEALKEYPYLISNFHSDNGSEYINKRVAEMLERLRIRQTKSRARHSNDNGLVEGKNNAIIRKNLGYSHIPKRFATLINNWCHLHLNPYNNFHRQCTFATDIVDAKGKIRKIYKIHMTPCQKLLSIQQLERYLKPDITRESLATTMMAKTHLQAAQEKEAARGQLFDTIRQKR
jgi:hypothetical protein